MEEDEDDTSDDDDDEEEEDDDDDQEKAPRELTAEEAQLRAQRRATLVSSARSIFNRAYESLKQRQLKEERVALLEAWKTFESAHGTGVTLGEVEEKFPRVVKKRREVDDGSGAMEEYYDLIFPDDEEKGKERSSCYRWHMLGGCSGCQGARARAGAGGAGGDERAEEERLSTEELAEREEEENAERLDIEMDDEDGADEQDEDASV